jgi:hypothetical protein
LRRRFFLILVLIVIIIGDSLIVAATNINIDRIKPLQLVAGVHEIEGEILAINTDILIISEAGVDFKLKIAPQVKIYCNGLMASWTALRPITVQAFFDADVVLNGQNQVVLINGYYQGEECIIQGWWKNNEQICLQLKSSNDLHTKRRLIERGAILPKGHWLQMGQLVYILYNMAGNVRGVYLPD